MKGGIRTKRVYEPPDAGDGRRVLVDRLWPRGLSRAAARIDAWAKTVAPSTPLRQWYGHDPAKWDQFRRRYFAELDAHPEALAELRAHLGKETVTLLYSSKELQLNNATALQEYLTSASGRHRRPPSHGRTRGRGRSTD
jgi:uncharacterized protein YeaO (DUF488 family)